MGGTHTELMLFASWFSPGISFNGLLYKRPMTQTKKLLNLKLNMKLFLINRLVRLTKKNYP